MCDIMQLYTEVVRMIKVNPYRPGAGLMPGYIAGRDEDIENVEICLKH